MSTAGSSIDTDSAAVLEVAALEAVALAGADYGRTRRVIGWEFLTQMQE
jgi:hypothetical protein